MSGLCGFVGLNNDLTENRAIVTSMLTPVASGAAPPSIHSHSSFGVGCAAKKAKQCTVFARGDNVFAALGYPTFQNAPLLSERAMDSFSSRFMQVGMEAIAELDGGFCIAIVNGSEQSVTLAVDRMGIYPLYFAVHNRAFLFGTSSECLFRRTNFAKRISDQGIFNFLYFHVTPGPRTCYVGVDRLMPAQVVTYQVGGAVNVQSYWRIQFKEISKPCFPELQGEFVESLRSAVAAQAAGANTGTFLSGGTDSSTVAGLLTQILGEGANTFSIGFEATGYDEMSYARIAAKCFGTKHHEYYVTANDIVTAVPKIARAYDQPFGNSSAIPTYFCARLAESHGVSRLLGGDGGDELFGGNERYAKQRLFERYFRMPRVLRSGMIEPLVNNFPGGGLIAPVRKARSYIDQAKIPMPGRLESYNLLQRFGFKNVFEQAFLEEVDTASPLSILNEEYQLSDRASLINRMLALDFRITLADNDLPKVLRTCDLAGVEVAFPMLANGVVEFSAKLPSSYKLRGGYLRWFFKEALKGFLPDEIINKQKHGFGLPFGLWLTTHKGLQELVHDNLDALKRRQIVRSAFIDDLSDSKVAEHPGYYGTMAWVLMMLELWFQNHIDQ